MKNRKKMKLKNNIKKMSKKTIHDYYDMLFLLIAKTTILYHEKNNDMK